MPPADLPLASCVTLGLGGVSIDASSVWASLFQPSAASLSVADAAHRAIVFDLRLPRVLLAVLGGVELRVHPMRRTDAQARAEARLFRMTHEHVRWRWTESVLPYARRVLACYTAICCHPARRAMFTVP